MSTPEPFLAMGISMGGLILAALVQVPQALPDTVVMIQSTPTGWAFWVDLATSIASIIIALALIAIGTALIPAALAARKAQQRIARLLGQVQTDFSPIIKHGEAVAANLNYISSSIRADVEELGRTVQASNQRLSHAAEAAELRIKEFNALMRIVQDEAENLFIGTASTIRGVQAGTETFRRFRAQEEWDDEASAPPVRPSNHL